LFSFFQSYVLPVVCCKSYSITALRLEIPEWRRAIPAFTLDRAVDRIAAFLAGAFFLAIFVAARGFFGLPVGGDIRLGLGLVLTVGGLILGAAGFRLLLYLGAGFLAAGFLAARCLVDGLVGALRLSGIPMAIAAPRAPFISFFPNATATCFDFGFPADRDVTDLNAFFTFGTFIFFFGWFF
jgi:hypothetical protein